jgi:predicted membrane-bound spermidine synthase
MPQQLRLLLSVFVSGAVVMALELLGSRLLAPVFGNSIFVWGSLIGVVLAALSAGYYLGGKLADLQPNLHTLSIVIFAAGLLTLGLPALAPGVFDSTVKFGLGDRYSPLLATTILLGPPSVLLGMVAPYAIRLAAKSFEKLGKASGNLYALSTIGSIVGTFLTVFLLIPEFGVNRIIFALGVTLLVVAFLGLDLRLKVFVLLILAIVPFAAPYMVNHRLTVAAYTLALGDTVSETDTPYHDGVVADSFDPTYQTYDRILILDDNLHSAMDLKNPDRTVFTYTDYFHLGFLLNPNITRVLFVGGGGFTGPKTFLKDYPEVEVDVAEIDPEVIRVAEQYFGVDSSNPRLHIYNEDGRIFLQRTTQKYDLVVLDAYSKSYVPFHLMTAEFFESIANHLTSKGSVISNLIAAISGDSSELLRAEGRTIQVAFPNIYAFAVEGTSYRGPQNIIILATLLPQSLSEGEFERLAATTSVIRIPTLTLEEYVANYFKVDSGDAPVLTDNYAPVETLLSPITGQPLNSDTGSAIIAQEVERLVAIALVGVVVFVILRTKKIV